MPLIDAEGLSFRYDDMPEGRFALDGASLKIDAGELVAVLGCAGSGKSTLARLFNALLPIQGGRLFVCGCDARESARVWQLRRNVGMVFTRPGAQLVSSYVEEELSFGPRCFGAAQDALPARVDAALSAVGLRGYERRSPQLLPDGEKQLIALAGVLACEAEVIILDDACAFLSPPERARFLSTVLRLHAAGQTIVMMTSRAEDAALAGRVCVLEEGRILADGAAREVISDAALLERAGLDIPLPVRAYHALSDAGIALGACPLTLDELVDEVCR